MKQRFQKSGNTFKKPNFPYLLNVLYYQIYFVITSEISSLTHYMLQAIFTITVSCSFGLKAFILLFSREGCTRFVKSKTIILLSRSIQKDVPVNPRCPTLSLEKYLPQLDPFNDGVSNPSALLLLLFGLKNFF